MKNNDRSLLNPVRARTFPERHPDGLIGVDATSSSGPHDRAESGEQVGAPVGSEAAGGCGTEFAFAAVVVRADLGMFEEGEQVSADLAVLLYCFRKRRPSRLAPGPSPRRVRAPSAVGIGGACPQPIDVAAAPARKRAAAASSFAARRCSRLPRWR